MSEDRFCHLGPCYILFLCPGPGGKVSKKGVKQHMRMHTRAHARDSRGFRRPRPKRSRVSGTARCFVAST